MVARQGLGGVQKSCFRWFYSEIRGMAGIFEVRFMLFLLVFTDLPPESGRLRHSARLV